ncbi:carbon-nitrogen hydrolase family protein [Desertihabitans aurantiacus]|uniref:carbon-nitrogen hydrolase family protein n=1 Tax=Desertihabitans aurantiacus TaxID=2282477 RepID=UPI0013001F42|nr:carbon-nitrogen hydrolase family protein [Desertihabitans aurantiacus]
MAVGQGIGSERPSAQAVRDNATAICEVMREAHQAGARLVVFTEGALSTYPGKRMMSSDPARLAEADWSRMPWDVLAVEVERVAELAGELGVWVVVGSVWPADGAGRPFNSLLVIDDTGVVVDRYDKRYLSRTEADFMYQPGAAPVVVDVDGFRFGLLLCIEALLPDAVIEYETLGVDAVVISTFTAATPQQSQDDQRALAHATMIDGWTILAAPGTAPGHMPSAVAAAGFTWLAQGRPDGTVQTVIADLDRDEPRIRFGRERGRTWRELHRASAASR